MNINTYINGKIQLACNVKQTQIENAVKKMVAVLNQFNLRLYFFWSANHYHNLNKTKEKTKLVWQ